MSYQMYPEQPFMQPSMMANPEEVQRQMYRREAEKNNKRGLVMSTLGVLGVLGGIGGVALGGSMAAAGIASGSAEAAGAGALYAGAGGLSIYEGSQEFKKAGGRFNEKRVQALEGAAGVAA